MISDFYLPGLIDESSIDKQVYELVRDKMPKTFLFYYDTDAYYRLYSANLDTYKIREKRLLDFETPNRALITHEYDMKLTEDFDYSIYYYLFNPINRLSWLKILQDNKRLSIAGENEIKNLIKKDIQSEFDSIDLSIDDFFEELWSNKTGLPCFIKLNDSVSNDILLTASYYDSIKEKCKFSKFDILRNKIKFLILPFEERRIQYKYFPLNKKSSWLYIKAPDNFNTRFNVPKFELHKDLNSLCINEKEADPEKLSMTIINTRSHSTKEDTVTISFDIFIPKSLKIWFLCVYYIAILVMILLFIPFLNKVYLFFFDPIFLNFSFNHFFENIKFNGVALSIIAAIIATRGWLISEETIFKKYSIRINYIMVLILLLLILNRFC